MLFVIVSTYNRDHIFYVIHSSIDLPDCTTKTFDAVITKTIKTVASKAILDLDKSRVIVYLIYFSSQKFLFLELNNFYNIYTKCVIVVGLHIEMMLFIRPFEEKSYKIPLN